MPSANYTDDDIRLAFEYEDVQKYVNEALKATHYASKRDWNAAVRWYREKYGGDFNALVSRRDELKKYFGGKNASRVVQGLVIPPAEAPKPSSAVNDGQESANDVSNAFFSDDGTPNFQSIYDEYMKVVPQGMKDRLASILDIYSIEDIEEAFMNRWSSRYVPPPVVPQTPVVIYQGAVPNYDRGGYQGSYQSSGTGGTSNTGSSGVDSGRQSSSSETSVSKSNDFLKPKHMSPISDRNEITYGSPAAIKWYIESNPEYSWFDSRHKKTIRDRISSLSDADTADNVRYYINKTGGKRYPEAEYYLSHALNENNYLPRRKQSLNTFFELMIDRYGRRYTSYSWSSPIGIGI